MTWLALEHWSGRKASTEVVVETIRSNGTSLKDWLSAFTSGGTTQAIGSEWLRTWGLDLHRLTEDRDARNLASYRPTGLNQTNGVSALKASGYLVDLWQLYDPTTQSPFEILDRHLIRNSLEQAFYAITGNEASADPTNFAARVARVVASIGVSGPSIAALNKFLLRQSAPIDPEPIVAARQLDLPTAPLHHLQVISRAALLTRVATGACAQLIKETGTDRDGLSFWWQAFGEERGLWKPGDEPYDFTDLWADVDTAILDAKNWRSKCIGTSPSIHEWHQHQSSVISVLGGCERIALWGLGI